MIEYALLFGLGFLTAAFLVFLIAPAVHRRVVWYTEKRLRATMPLSAREVRAQKDMVRAVYAAENARTAQELARERERLLSLQLNRDVLTEEASRLAAEVGTLEAQVAAMHLDAAELRSQIRKDENLVNQLRENLERAEENAANARAEIAPLRERANKFAVQIDILKIDLAARNAQINEMTEQVEALGRERDVFRQQAQEAQAELAAAKEELSVQREKPGTDAQSAEATFMEDNEPIPQGITAEALAEHVKARASALSQRLADAGESTAEDAALREEISAVAARLVALTALREGPTSPILPLLADAGPVQDGKRANLAQKAASILAKAKEA